MKTNAIVISLLMLAVIFIVGCDKSSSSGPQRMSKKKSNNPSPVAITTNTIPHYRVVSVEDVSHGFPRDSAINVKKVYRILVPVSTSTKDVETVIRDVQQSEARKDHNIDEMAIFIFDREADVQGPYTRGRGFWGVDGDIGRVTASIAVSNDRSQHSLSVDLKQPIKRAAANKTQKKYDLNSNELTAFEEEVSAAVFTKFNNMPDDWDGEDNAIMIEIGKRYNLSPETVRNIDSKVTGIKAGIRWK